MEGKSVSQTIEAIVKWLKVNNDVTDIKKKKYIYK